ncbi:MAG: polysaccharide biosynthesis C-terminal domain-containing protein, partial [Calditrichia bacterium]
FIKDILTFYYFNDFYLLWPRYWPGIDFIPWILLSYFFYGIYVIFTPAFYITKKSQYMVLFTGTGAILNIVTNIILLPRIGIWGAVIATVAAYLSMFLLIYFISQKLYPIPVNLKSLLGVFLTIGLGYLIYYIIGPNFLFRAIIFVLLGVFAFFTALSASERKGLILSLTDRIKVKK